MERNTERDLLEHYSSWLCAIYLQWKILLDSLKRISIDFRTYREALRASLILEKLFTTIVLYYTVVLSIIYIL